MERPAFSCPSRQRQTLRIIPSESGLPCHSLADDKLSALSAIHRSTRFSFHRAFRYWPQIRTTVIYTYEFVGAKQSAPPAEDSWNRLRGALKDVFAELGGGEAYLRAERRNFYPMKEDE